MTSFRLYFVFYSGFAPFNLIISSLCWWLIHKHGVGAYATLFYFKIITLALVYYFINANRSHEIYYYKNLGVSKFRLWTFTLSFDMILFLFIIFLMLR